MKKIALSQKQFALVDNEDFEELSKYKWFAHKSPRTFYAVRKSYVKGKQFSTSMHTHILGKKPGHEIDHINHNGLDNRKNNLRHVTRQENIFNSGKRKNNLSGITGVSKLGAKWLARIQVNRKEFYLGMFPSKQEAAEAYTSAKKSFHVIKLKQ